MRCFELIVEAKAKADQLHLAAHDQIHGLSRGHGQDEYRALLLEPLVWGGAVAMEVGLCLHALNSSDVCSMSGIGTRLPCSRPRLAWTAFWRPCPWGSCSWGRIRTSAGSIWRPAVTRHWSRLVGPTSGPLGDVLPDLDLDPVLAVRGLSTSG